MPSVWDDFNIGTYDLAKGQWRPATPGEQARGLAERERRKRASRNEFIRNAVYGTAGVVAGGYGLAALTGGAPMAALTTPASVSPNASNAAIVASMGNAPIASTVAAPVITSSVAPSVAPAAAGGLFRMSDIMRYGVPAGVDLVTGAMANRANTKAANAAALEQARQFDATQAWLREQDEKDRAAFEATEAEKRRQWEATTAEDRRRYDILEPWRESARGNLTRMNAMLDRPKPGRVDYRPTFTYRP